MIARCYSSSLSSKSTESEPFQSLNGLRQLAETRRFKAWFLDQFGVLHDGKQPYSVEKLATSGAKMVIISNSSRRASTTIEKLSSLGFDPSLFLGAITSGELTHEYLLRRDDAWFSGLGRSCIHMTWNDRGTISLEGLGLQVVDNVKEAEFVLAHGTEALGCSSGAALPKSLEELEKVLEQCAAKRIPMVVANPDFVTVESRALRAMPGTLAATYEKLGGEVKWMGKPGEVTSVRPGKSKSPFQSFGDILLGWLLHMFLFFTCWNFGLAISVCVFRHNYSKMVLSLECWFLLASCDLRKLYLLYLDKIVPHMRMELRNSDPVVLTHF